MQLLKAFVVGSSLPVVILFLIATALNKKKSFSYEAYSIIAPTFFGFISVLLAYLFKKPKLNNYMITGLLTSLFVLVLNYNLKTYPFQTWEDWLRYYIRLLPGHLFALLVIFILMNKI